MKRVLFPWSRAIYRDPAREYARYSVTDPDYYLSLIEVLTNTEYLYEIWTSPSASPVKQVENGRVSNKDGVSSLKEAKCFIDKKLKKRGWYLL